MKRLFRSQKYNPVALLMERIPGLTGITGIRLTPTAYNQMKKDPKLQKVEGEGELEYWYAEETEINGTYFEPIQYALLLEPDGGAIVAKIEYGNDSYELSSDWNFEINYKDK